MSADATKPTAKTTTKSTTKPRTTTKKTNESGQLPWLAIIAIVVAVIACAAAAYVFYQGQQLQVSASSLHDQVSTVQSQIQTTQSQAKAFQQTVLAAQSKESMQIKQAMLQLSQDKSKAAKTIALGSAIYLARLANLAIIIDHDPKLAAHLLQMAQHHLKDVPAFADLRNSIIHFHTQLLAVPELDLDGVLMQLGGIKQVIIHIDTLPKPALNKSADNAQKHPAHVTANWQMLWTYLKQFFVITHHDGEHASLPTLTHIQSVKDSAFLSLSTAQWAVLHQQPAIYHHAIHAAQLQLKTITQVHPQAIKQLLASLNDLDKVDVQPSYPQLGHLVDALMQAQIATNQRSVVKSVVKPKQTIKATPKKIMPSKKAVNKKLVVITKPKVMQGVEA